MDQNQSNDAEIVQAPATEVSVEEKSEGDEKPFYKSTHFVSASIVLGCLIFVGVYLYVQIAAEEDVVEDVNIEVPTDIEENEPSSAYDDSYGEPDLGSGYGDESNNESSEKTFIHTLTADPNRYSEYYKKLIPQDGVVWQEHPTPVDDSGLFSVTENYLFKNKKFQYYQIGTVDSKPLLVTMVPYCEMGCLNSMLYFIKESPESYTFLEAQSTNELTSRALGFATGFTLADNVKIDRDFKLTAHQVPEKVTISNVVFTAQQGAGRFDMGPSFFADTYYNTAKQERGEVVKFFTDTEYGPAFRGFRDMSEGKTQDLDYAIRLAGGLMLTLNYKPDFIWDDRVPRIGWLNGTDNESAYRTDGLGSCGGGGPEIMKEPIPSEDLLLAGYTVNQEPVYKVVDPNQYVITRLFTDGDTRTYYEYNIVTNETETRQISKSDFIDEGGVIIYVDKFGFQHVLTHTKYGPQAECAKPVVYLYPEEPTNVTVTLDALVTVSEPSYGSGWSVVAHPDGALIVNGKEFDSLFWDGYGNGEYPELTEGFVVQTPEALPLMKKHLEIMGFNEKEIADFVEFWGPHMPTEPYTRFSWIGTIGMENLAKLTVNPEPDTLIRAFVDFEGLQESISLEPQKIPVYERKGFVVTEWGGLLQR